MSVRLVPQKLLWGNDRKVAKKQFTSASCLLPVTSEARDCMSYDEGLAERLRDVLAVCA